MPYTGATFNLVTNDWYPAVEETTIDPDASNEMLEDIATGLTAVLKKDGSGGMTANLPMNSNKLTGLAAGTSNGDSLRYEQLTALSLVYQPLDALLSAIAALSIPSGSFIRSTGTDTVAAYDLFGTASTWTALMTLNITGNAAIFGSTGVNADNFITLRNDAQSYNVGVNGAAGDELYAYHNGSGERFLTVDPATRILTLLRGLILPETPSAISSLSAGYLGLGGASAPDATYTFVLADAGQAVDHASGSAHAYTVPPAASVAYPANTVLCGTNFGSGALTIGRGAGVTFRNEAGTDADLTVPQWASYYCRRHPTSADVWTVRVS